MTTQKEDEAGPMLSDKALAAIIESVIWRQSILPGCDGGGGISDAIAQWRSEDHLRESNKIIEELSLKIAQRVLKYVPSSAPTGFNAGVEAAGVVAKAWGAARASLCVCKNPSGSGEVYKAGPSWPVGDPKSDKLLFSADDYAKVDEFVENFCGNAVIDALRTAPATSAPAVDPLAILRGLAANDGNPDQHTARRALAIIEGTTELYHRDREAEKLADAKLTNLKHLMIGDWFHRAAEKHKDTPVPLDAPVQDVIEFALGWFNSPYVAALRQAQPPQPTGDVGELVERLERHARIWPDTRNMINEVVAALRSIERRSQRRRETTGDAEGLSEQEREHLRWLKAAGVGSAATTAELLAIIDRLNSRLAALADQRDYYKARDDEGAKIEAELREAAKGQLVVVNAANARAEAAEAQMAILTDQASRAKRAVTVCELLANTLPNEWRSKGELHAALHDFRLSTGAGEDGK